MKFFALSITLAFLSFSTQMLFAQTGAISGTVLDDDNKPVKEFTVRLSVANKAVIDLEKGTFLFSALSAGTYTVEIKAPGFDNYKSENITVTEGQTTTTQAKLKTKSQTTGDIRIERKTDKNKGDMEVTKMQINQAGVVDGINKNTFVKTPDSRVSQVFKRVSGASVQDNKFVVVRGLSDRYNFALINGAPLPSTESDRKAFSFDIFPSNTLENLFIMKSATPELPGEFAGGVIDIKTIEPRAEKFQSIQIGAGFNTIATLKDFRSYDGAPTDVLGFGNSARAIPEGLPSTADFNALSAVQKAEYAKFIPSSWATTRGTALPNGSLQYSLGDKIKFNDKKSLSYVLAYSYANTNNFSAVTRREFEEQEVGVITKSELKDSAFTKSILNTGLLNLKFDLGKRTEIQLRTLYSVSSDDKVNVRQGKRDMDIESMYNERSTNIWYTQNNLLTTQLIGKHNWKDDWKFNWVAGYSNVARQIPFLRRVVYQQVDTTLPYFAVVQPNGISTLGAGNMFWSTMTENIASARYDFSKQVGGDDSKNLLKFGGMHQYRGRDFAARNLGFSKYDPVGSASFNSNLLLLPEDQIFAAENLGLMADGQGGFKLEEGTNVDDSYDASSLLNAAYAMIDARVFSKLRVVTGVRAESYQQKFHYVEFGSNLDKYLDTTVIDLLPSLNLTYKITERFQWRASAARTVSRPEFRELAPFVFYNFLNDNLVSGSPELKRASINNYDTRLEYFPGKGQIISVSGFYKTFDNPIELLLRTGTSGQQELYYSNIDKAKTFGAELEYRMNLGWINRTDSNSIFSKTTFYTNASYIRSDADVSDIAGLEEYPDGNRPLQGQSPYILNVGLFYESAKELVVNFSYNYVGQRIAITGSIQEPSVWENGRHVLDFQIGKTWKDKYELKLNCADLLAQDLVFFQDINKNKRYDKGVDSAWQEITFGQTITLNFKYKF
ncbi:MAG: PEGA domain-containing protein [Flavobacteriia bacterium]|nr:PEGA domain-containing protein [Flavobacteriia bacterium]